MLASWRCSRDDRGQGGIIDSVSFLYNDAIVGITGQFVRYYAFHVRANVSLACPRYSVIIQDSSTRRVWTGLSEGWLMNDMRKWILETHTLSSSSLHTHTSTFIHRSKKMSDSNIDKPATSLSNVPRPMVAFDNIPVSLPPTSHFRSPSGGGLTR
jgi:hypothetical protein